jgi:very-short-patch-repair endonuclease
MFTAADHRLAELSARHHSVFTLWDAREAGLTHGQIDRRVAGAWVHVHDGVYRMAGVSPTWKGALLAACWVATPPRAISHRAAAALYEMPGGRSDLIELTCKRWRRARRAGLVVHESRRLDESDIREVDGIPVMRPERVILELAGLRPSSRCIEAVVHAARRKRLITFESTLELFDRHARRGLRGVGVLRAVLDQWDPRQRPTESEMETLLFRVLVDAGYPEPTPQFEITDRFGNFVARADMALPAWKIAIEYDSKQEHSDEFQLARDARRRNRVVAAGWRQISARHADLTSGGAELLDAIDATRRSA